MQLGLIGPGEIFRLRVRRTHYLTQCHVTFV